VLTTLALDSLTPVAAVYTLKVRAGGRVRKQQHRGLGEALAGLEREGRELEARADGRARGGVVVRRLEPVQVVAGRVELFGPGGLRAGVDVRGDGSSEAFTGRLKRRVVEPRSGESAYDALRRGLAGRQDIG
jgi:hypothetical protein